MSGDDYRERWERETARRRSFFDRYFCAICRAAPPQGDFQAKNEIWAEAGLGSKEFACVTCFAIRLGRPLRVSDFVDCPASAAILYGLRLSEALE